MPRFPQFKLIHWLLITAIVVVLVALLIPQAKWASDGEITVLVVVTVFDAATANPIQGARVAVLRGTDAELSDENRDWLDRISYDVETLDENGVTTDIRGKAEVETVFRTSASNVHPGGRAHTDFYWVLVSADGYGGVVVPVRYQSIESHVLREKGNLPVSIGLIRADRVSSPIGDGQ
ncbi:MAG: hypothetical protein KDA88_04775 [Planctomycetaceae bacterium]|nr:hypothetical protein [Planctomycetaceae bacterium]MCB9950118.1 hypothetical protein [Planctomycetaceae bacterium]